MLEQLFYMILRGIIIGVVVSAPMGPVGIFCIQRSLDKGRKSGFYTGVGAAISDLIYCILTGFCLSFIEEFINMHRSPIQIIGSSVLIGFGIWLIKKKPEDTMSPDAGQGSPSVEGDILKGFALTFSNPLILFLIIGLFAQFNFVIEGMTFLHYVLGFIGIISGALGWWWTVTFFVDKLRCHFNQGTMKLINTIVGIIILVFAAVGIISATSAYAHGGEVFPRKTMSASFRVADTSMKGWHAVVTDTSGKGFRMKVMPAKIAEPFGDTDYDVLNLEVADMSGKFLAAATLSEGVDPYRGSNSWRIVREGARWNIFAGNREYQHRVSFDLNVGPTGTFQVESVPGGSIDYTMMGIDSSGADYPEYIASDIDDILQKNKGGKVELAGYYSLFDYEQDDSYAKIGGQYRLAFIPADSDGNYDIVYMSGARTMSDMWKPGMRKGRLKASAFGGVYDVEWVDAEGAVMLHDVQADFDSMTQIITVRFPYQNTILRFRKVNN